MRRMRAVVRTRHRGKWAAGVQLECAARRVFADGIDARLLRPVEEAGLPADCKPVEQAKTLTAGLDSQAGLLTLARKISCSIPHLFKYS